MSGGVEQRSRERILAAAAEIAAESGYEGTTISKITKRSGLHLPAIEHEVPGRLWRRDCKNNGVTPIMEVAPDD